MYTRCATNESARLEMRFSFSLSRFTHRITFKNVQMLLNHCDANRLVVGVEKTHTHTVEQSQCQIETLMRDSFPLTEFIWSVVCVNIFLKS